ncbi:MAG: fused signal recognition particle receptor [Clostridiales bacterium]|nr:fused signal recognition particle receptor [Clostridiales bacterium]
MALSFFSKLKEGLEKTRKGITDKIDDLFTRYGEIDDDLFEELEEILITADVGMQTTMKLIDMLKEELRIRKIKEASAVKDVFKDVVEKLLVENGHTAFDVGNEPTIIMVIGVNGVGKTTSIGKIANLLKAQGKSVLIAAGDTFRAAAIDQLKVWGDRVGVSVIHQSEGSDPAAVIFDAVQSAKAKRADVLICDTAGRLHNKVNLMNELSKVFRVIDREYPEAKKEVLLVLDATTGQNAVQQAKVFNEAAEISGIVLTKLDGTAKGGVVLAISSELQIPVKLIGVGEGIDDLQQFNPHDFAEALMGSRNA